MTKKGKKKKSTRFKRPTIKRIVEILRDYYPKRYPNDKSAYEKAKEISDLIKNTGESATVKTILSFVRKKRDEKFVPKLPPEMAGVENYFVLTRYPSLILTEVDPRITLVSRVSRKDLPPIRGLTEPDYYEYFADFVNHCNELSRLSEDGRYEKDWFVTTRLIDKDRYVFEIIPCTIDGDEYYYGFDRDKPTKTPTEPQTTDVVDTKKKEEEPVTKEEPKKETPEADKEIELSKQREKESAQREKELEKKRQLLKEKIEAIEKLKAMGFSNEDIKDLLRDTD